MAALVVFFFESGILSTLALRKFCPSLDFGVCGVKEFSAGKYQKVESRLKILSLFGSINMALQDEFLSDSFQCPLWQKQCIHIQLKDFEPVRWRLRQLSNRSTKPRTPVMACCLASYTARFAYQGGYGPQLPVTNCHHFALRRSPPVDTMDVDSQGCGWEPVAVMTVAWVLSVQSQV